MQLINAALLVLSLVFASARADVLDPDSDPIPILRDLSKALHEAGVDVLYSHDSETGAAGPSFGDRARVAPLLGFKGWSGATVNLDRYGEWLDAFETGARGAIAAVPSDAENKRPDWKEFQKIWKKAPDGKRFVITFDREDLEAAEGVARVLEASGHAVYLAMADPEHEHLGPEILGKLFVAADHCLVIDTAAARLNGVIKFEADLLAELRRQKTWVATAEDELPPVKRGSMDVVEALGVLPMKVLPGGIVLGVTPSLDERLTGAARIVNGAEYALGIDDRRFVVEQVSPETRRAIDAFVAIEESDSVVDIAGGKVTLATPFEGTNIGQRMTQSDRMPFEHLKVKGAQKSLIVDHAVHLRRKGDRVAADVTLEVRFYRRNDEGYAERLATLRFTVQDATGSKRLLDLSWSRRPDVQIAFNGSGADALADSLEQCATDAALIAIARHGRG